MAILHPRYGNYDFSRLAPTDVAWAAGFFDGEGNVSIVVRKRPANRTAWFMLRVQVANTHRGSLERFRDIFGAGTVYTRTPIPGRRIVYTCVAADRSAEIILTAIQPYSVVKSPQIELALRFRAMGQRRPFEKVSKERHDAMQEIRMAVSELNGTQHRSTKPPPMADVEV